MTRIVLSQTRNPALRDAYTQYLDKLTPHKERPLSEKSRMAYDNVMKNHISDWADKAMVSITSKMLYERYKKVSQEQGRGGARMMAALVGAIWSYANTLADDTDDGEDVFGQPPLRMLNKLLKGWRKGGARTRKIGMDELPEWLSAVRNEGGIGGAYLEVLLLTGMRRRELSGLKWENVNMRRRILILLMTKNGTDHTLPISDRVMEILRWSKRKYPDATGPIPLNDPRTIITYVTNACGIEFSCHDLRRTFITLADRSGAGMYAAKAILNHSVGKDVTGAHYASYSDVSDLREPLQAIESFILGQGEGSPG